MLPPGLGRLQVLQLLARMRAPAQTASKPTGQPNRRGQNSANTRPSATRLGDLLTRADTLLRRRSLVFVVSDFISEPGWAAPLGRLARRHEVLAVRLVDPLEMALPDIGLLTVEDAETGEQVWVDTQDAGFRQRFAALAAGHEAQLREHLTSAGVDVLELTTDEDLLAPCCATWRCAASAPVRPTATGCRRHCARPRRPDLQSECRDELSLA